MCIHNSFWLTIAYLPPGKLQIFIEFCIIWRLFPRSNSDPCNETLYIYVYNVVTGTESVRDTWYGFGRDPSFYLPDISVKRLIPTPETCNLDSRVLRVRYTTAPYYSFLSKSARASGPRREHLWRLVVYSACLYVLSAAASERDWKWVRRHATAASPKLRSALSWA